VVVELTRCPKSGNLMHGGGLGVKEGYMQLIEHGNVLTGMWWVVVAVRC
jgi:hypothetical protein